MSLFVIILAWRIPCRGKISVGLIPLSLSNHHPCQDVSSAPLCSSLILTSQKEIWKHTGHSYTSQREKTLTRIQVNGFNGILGTLILWHTIHFSLEVNSDTWQILSFMFARRFKQLKANNRSGKCKKVRNDRHLHALSSKTIHTSNYRLYYPSHTLHMPHPHWCPACQSLHYSPLSTEPSHLCTSA